MTSQSKMIFNFAFFDRGTRSKSQTKFGLNESVIIESKIFTRCESKFLGIAPSAGGNKHKQKNVE